MYFSNLLLNKSFKVFEIDFIMHIISIGKDCGVSIALRNLGLRKVAYPWDWARYTEVSDIIDIIQNKDTFVVEEWRNLQNVYEYLPHDKPGDSHGNLENYFENTTLIEKYKRRFERFFQHIQEPDTYIIRFGPPSDVQFLNILSEMLPNVKVIFIENGRDSDENTYNILRSIFTQERDETNIFINQMLKIYENLSIRYPCNVNKIVEKMQELNIQEKYLTYITSFQPDAIFYTKDELMQYVGMALKKNGLEYSIL